MTNHNPEVSPHIYTKIAGLAYILIITIGVLNGSFIDSKLIVTGNDALTANNILANDLLFRIGIASILILYACVVVLSWALYVILKPVNKNLALLGMLLRAGEAILGAATVLIDFIVLQLLNGKGFSTVFGTEQLQALAGVFLGVRTAGLDIVLLFVGLGGALFCYLFFTSKYVPRLLAGWGIFTYLSMIVLSLISILFPNHPVMIEIVLYSQGALFEVIFGFWLLFKGVKVNRTQ
jgi:hypothetical protein